MSLISPEKAVEKLKSKNCKCCRIGKATPSACRVCEVQFAIEIIERTKEKCKNEKILPA